MRQDIYLTPGGGPGGKKEDTAEGFRMAIDAIGKERPSIAVIGTASKDNWPFYMGVRSLLQKCGAGDVRLVRLCGKKVDAEKCRKELEDADAVFINGGDVDVGMDYLVRTGFDRVLRELYENGKHFFGLSAGMIMMGAHWAHWEVEDDDSTASLIDCLGFIDKTFDAHSEGEGWRELKCVLRLLGDGSVGYGMTSGVVAKADPEGNLTVLRGKPDVFRNAGGVIEDAEP